MTSRLPHQLRRRGVTMSDATVAIAVATVVSAAISAGAAYLTQRSSSRSHEVVAQTETRGDIERDAFQRAQAFYTDVIERQDAENEEQAAQIRELKSRVATLEDSADRCQQELAHVRRIGKRMARGVLELRKALSTLDIATPADPGLDEVVLEMLGDPPPRRS